MQSLIEVSLKMKVYKNLFYTKIDSQKKYKNDINKVPFTFIKYIKL